MINLNAKSQMSLKKTVSISGKVFEKKSLLLTTFLNDK